MARWIPWRVRSRRWPSTSSAGRFHKPTSIRSSPSCAPSRAGRGRLPMNRLRFGQIVLLMLAAVALTALFVASRPPDENVHASIIDNLREIRETDAALGQRVLQARAGALLT